MDVSTSLATGLIVPASLAIIYARSTLLQTMARFAETYFPVVPLSMKRGSSAVILASCIASFLSIQQGSDDLKSKILIFLVRAVHFTVTLFMSFYIFCIDRRFDMAYLAIFNAIVIHWAFLRKECILNVLEARIRDPSYKIGSNIRAQPYLHDLFGKTGGKHFWTLMVILYTMGISLVMLRLLGALSPTGRWLLLTDVAVLLTLALLLVPGISPTVS